MARLVAIWHGAMLEVRLDNVEQVAALALQGPTSGRLLRAVADAVDHTSAASRHSRSKRARNSGSAASAGATSGAPSRREAVRSL